jgi:UTP-glucose-1-phosphate uridylyltransferase
MKPTLVILAAGMGSRYGGLKQIDKLGPSGETIIDYSVYDAMNAGFDKVVFVIRKSIETDFKEAIADKYSGKIAVDYVLQELEYVPEGITINPERQKPWGTGHAILMTAEKVTAPFAVINGDDFYGADAFVSMAQFLTQLPSDDTTHYSMVGYRLGNTLSENGYVSRGVCSANAKNELTDVVEHTQIERKNNQIEAFDDNNNVIVLAENTPVSMNFWGFTPSIFGHLNRMFTHFIKTQSDNIKAEFYIPTVVNELIHEQKVSAKILDTTAQWFGVTYQEDRKTVVEKLSQLHNEKIYPSPLWK